VRCEKALEAAWSKLRVAAEGAGNGGGGHAVTRASRVPLQFTPTLARGFWHIRQNFNYPPVALAATRPRRTEGAASVGGLFGPLMDPHPRSLRDQDA
jgi:hypothetical protein